MDLTQRVNIIHAIAAPHAGELYLPHALAGRTLISRCRLSWRPNVRRVCKVCPQHRPHTLSWRRACVAVDRRGQKFFKDEVLIYVGVNQQR